MLTNPRQIGSRGQRQPQPQLTASNLPGLPIIREALAANGITVEKALADLSWQEMRSPLVTSATRMDIPFLLFDARGGTVDWGQKKITFRFTKVRSTYEFTLETPIKDLPESALIGLVGEKLSRLVDLPGSNRYEIDGFSSDAIGLDVNASWIKLRLINAP